ncbi:MAG: hypothetical protein M1338_01765 [Patescibacteria group bacterium]|nr:hypothetical protein [Patescibacteria group bacterium]
MDIEAANRKGKIKGEEKNTYLHTTDKLDGISSQNKKEFQQIIEEIIQKVFDKKFGPGYKYDVQYAKEKGFGFNKTLKMIIPLGEIACHGLEKGAVIRGNQVISPYNKERLLNRFKEENFVPGNDPYYIEVYPYEINK